MPDESTWLWVAEVKGAGGFWGWTPLRRIRPSFYPDSIMEELRKYAEARPSWKTGGKQYRIHAYRPTQDVHTIQVEGEGRCAHAGVEEAT